jgi:L-lactate dehydrogenase complex protein LldG
MSKDSKEEILNGIKIGLYKSPINQDSEEKTPLFFSVDRQVQQKGVLKLCENLQEKKWTLIERFIGELTKVSGKVRVAKNEYEIREFIIGLAEEHNAGSLAMWESDLIRQLNLYELVENLGLRVVYLNNTAEIATADIGITETDFAIADTGTIVLMANEKQPRSMSLLPSIHIALMKSDIIVENLENLFFLVKNSYNKLDKTLELTSCMTFITGPSRTADIELNLTLGVHGPRELIVIIYP